MSLRRFLSITSHIMRVSFTGSSVMAILLLTATVCSAQGGVSEGQIGGVASVLPESAVPATFVSTSPHDEWYAEEPCSGCGSCDSCVCHDGWFHRWCHLWDGGVDVGLNGAEGSSRDTNLVVGLDAKRQSGLNTVSLDLDYLFQRESSAVTKNRLYTLGRYERDIPDSAWSWFTDGWYEYDQFEAWRSRIGLHGGAGVLLKDTECCTLKGLMGLGTSKKAQGQNTDWTPEAMLGTDAELRLTDRQKLKATVNYYPDVGDIGNFRLNTRGSYELLIDEEHDLSLAISAFDRYDSTPDPGDPANELDYWLSIHWGF